MAYYQKVVSLPFFVTWVVGMCDYAWLSYRWVMGSDGLKKVGDSTRVAHCFIHSW